MQTKGSLLRFNVAAFSNTITIFVGRTLLLQRVRSITTCNHPHTTHNSAKPRPTAITTEAQAPVSAVDVPWALGGRVPRGFWQDHANQVKFFDWAAKQLQIARLEDWYKVRREDVFRIGGCGLLTWHYRGSLFAALSKAYPHIEWLPWRFENISVPRRFWSDVENHKRFFEWAAEQLNITNPEQWYAVKVEDLERLNGRALLNSYYDTSLFKALSRLYPETEWLPWRFASGVPKGFWLDQSNHRRFFDWVAQELQIHNDEDWYQVTREDVYKLGGVGLLDNYYDSSLIKALAIVYPHVKWHPWRFRYPNKESSSFSTQSSSSTSSSSNNNNNNNDNNSNYNNDNNGESDLKRYVEFLAQELRLETLDDWYRVSVHQLRRQHKRLGCLSLLAKYGGLYPVLRRVYPEHHWDEEQLQKAQGKKASQRLLRLSVLKLFANEEILEEYAHPSLYFNNGNDNNEEKESRG